MKVMNTSPTNLAAWLLLAVALCAVEATTAVADELSERVGFNEHIRPIFNAHCVGCHGGPKQAGGLSLLYRDKALAETDSGVAPIVPGDAEASYLVDRIAETDPEFRMPPAEHGPALTPHQVALVRKWIDQGAEWQEHWSFIAPQPMPVPEVSGSTWPRGAIDRFVLAKLRVNNMAPSAEADKREWLRRVTFDLIGLPPTLDEIEAFVADTSDDAYEKVVDRLLASPKYGERWAAVWLDLARYADTMGYEKDPHREIWPYRDWLIRALGDDMPYDEFTKRQLAGDLLPGATIDDRVATAFHRNTQCNTEGGTDDEEFRVAAVMDRASTTWQVWGATTFGCCQCHDHPYDPITQQEYYQFLAILDDTRDADIDEEWPRLQVPTSRDDFAKAGQLDEQMTDVRRQMHLLASPLANAGEWLPLAIKSAESTGQTKLEIRNDPSGRSEFVTRGTVTAQSMFTISLAAGEPTAATALRIDALPQDLAAALKTPEQGFVVTRLRAWVVDASNSESPEREVFFSVAFCDDPAPLMPTDDVTRDNHNGWGSYSKLHKPRWAVFVFSEPLTLGPGTTLRLQLKHQRSATGEIALVINRGQFSIATSDKLTALAAGEYAELKGQLADLEAQRGQIASVSIPVVDELPANLGRETHTFARGNWLDKGERVEPNVPAVFPKPQHSGPVDRLAMAEWLVSGEHPLTARVMVNRLWAQLFGLGIVETAEDFGSSGLAPSHPELLDYLALRFQNEYQWRTKPLLKEIVLSSTYRQTARVSAKDIALDSRNRLLSRGPRTRLAAEMVRDQALAVAGLLSDKMYGPSVMPPQPDGVWRSVYSGATWNTAEGVDRYRRAIYTYWKRTSGYPAMLSFDVPSRDVCTVRRIPTNTPLQALVTLNDAAFVECATALARRAEAQPDIQGADDHEQRIAWIYEVVTGAPPEPSVIAELKQLFGEAARSYPPGDGPHKALGDWAEQYALTIVANTVLNLDEALTK
jgi:mono/diheme cytochrome c family protein